MNFAVIAKMKAVQFLIATCFTICAESQTQQYPYYSNGQLNSDLLYFSDNLPYSSQYMQNSRQMNIRGQDQSHITNRQPSMGPYTANNLNKPRQPENDLTPPFVQTTTPVVDLTRYGMEVIGLPTSSPENASLGITRIGLNILQNIDRSSGNTVVSPYSIAVLLAMLQQGSSGETQQQISRVLLLSPEVAEGAYRTLTDEVSKQYSHNILKVANNIFASDIFTINPAFKRSAIRNFNSEITRLNFASTMSAARQINAWVSLKTNNNIRELIQPDTLSENTLIVLANAIYFKGLWEIKFRVEATMPQMFLSKAGPKTVPFMRVRRHFRCDFDSEVNSQVLVMPFEKDEFSLVVILPSQVPVDTVLAMLTESRLADYQNMRPRDVAVELPKFTVRSNTDLNPVLKKMGITNIFGSKAELAGLGMYRTYSPQISAAIHSAMLSVDEEGGVAAAATAFAAVALSNDDPNIIFKANRPFIAVLWSNKASVPMFMAVVEDPLT